MPQRLLQPSIVAPGWKGMNTQMSGNLLSAEWAVTATNLVIDSGNRLASRKGTRRINSGTGAGVIGAGTEDVAVIHEYIDQNGDSITIFAAANKIYKDDGDGTITDLTGTITTPTANNWKFVNFNGKCIGFQADHAPIVITSIAGSFANITLSGTQQPTASANEVLAAFGRLWVLDGTNLKYSDALDHTAWNGVFDLKTIWLSGMDTGIALAEFNGFLVIFGRRSIVIYNNPWDPTGGGSLTTTQMTLVDNIAGVGCIARDSVQVVNGTDIVFLSETGLRSLGRVIQEKSTPINDLSKNVRDHVMGYVYQESTSKIRTVYSPSEGFYLVMLPTVSKVFVFDTHQLLDDGSARMTEWSLKISAAAELRSHELLLGRPGYVVEYTDYNDDVTYAGTGGTSYRVKYKSGWTDFGGEVAGLIKFPKRMSTTIIGGNSAVVTLLWSFDYNDTELSSSVTIPTTTGAEYGIAEYGIDEYSGGTYINNLRTQLLSSGAVMSFGVQTDVDGEIIGFQKIDLQIKVGRENI